jgi:hypothetical protein
MKYALTMAAILTFLLAAPALADDGHIPQATLSALGLAGMDTVSDEEGTQVRGMASGAGIALSRSMVTGLLIAPDTKSYVWGTDLNVAQACLDASCIVAAPDPYTETASTVELGLDVVTDSGSFSGVLIGGAGGYAFSLPF